MLISRKNQIIKLLRYSVVCVNGGFWVRNSLLFRASFTLPDFASLVAPPFACGGRRVGNS
jgi:hypothetical protein